MPGRQVSSSKPSIAELLHETMSTPKSELAQFYFATFGQARNQVFTGRTVRWRAAHAPADAPPCPPAARALGVSGRGFGCPLV